MIDSDAYWTWVHNSHSKVRAERLLAKKSAGISVDGWMEIAVSQERSTTFLLNLTADRVGDETELSHLTYSLLEVATDRYGKNYLLQLRGQANNFLRAGIDRALGLS